jgi:FkbM family methyltransferase
MIQLPLNHYLHLKRLADLRRCKLPEAINYLFKAIEANPHNWIDEHWEFKNEIRSIDFQTSYTQQQIMDRIQGLPRNIRPVTDGPYLDHFEFFSAEPGLLGIQANDVKILDFEMATHRDKAVFALVQDLLPPMTNEQYRIYNTFCSQYLRLVRQPELFTMPRKKAPAIDAGCYVGYKALALSKFTNGDEVLAFEIASDNFHILKLNAALNPASKLRPLEIALSDSPREMTLNVRNERTMAYSLTNFESLKEEKTPLLEGTSHQALPKSVQTCLLDDFTKDYKELSAVHISVNGHEPEVTTGAIDTLRKTDIMRISCPYKRNEKAVFDIVADILRKADINVFGKSGAAVIAGTSLGHYHIEKERPWIVNVLKKLKN